MKKLQKEEVYNELITGVIYTQLNTRFSKREFNSKLFQYFNTQALWKSLQIGCKFKVLCGAKLLTMHS